MSRDSHPFALLAISSALLALTVFLGFIVKRADFPSLLGAYTLFFALYVYVLLFRHWTVRQQYWFLGLGIALRVILLFSLPNLSDDFYRFLWDGRLAAHGIHPFGHPPSYFIENQISVPGITPELFQKLNSPEYHTVYPPVCQAVFWVAAKLFPESISGGVFILKLFLFGCELGTIWLLLQGLPNPDPSNPTPDPKGEGRHEGHRDNSTSPLASPLPFRGGVGGGVGGAGGGVRGASLAYALNPLILLEIVGNGHFEGAMLCFLLAGVYALARRRVAMAAVWWALATASKLVPLLFLLIVIVWLGWRRGLQFVVLFAGICCLLFLPLLDMQVMRNMADSLNLYFRQFEFNASIYYVLKWIGMAVAPPKMDVARTLGPVLAAVVVLGVAGLAFYKRSGNTNRNSSGYFFPDRLVFALMLYLALATTVHPWYVAPLFGLSLLTTRQFPFGWTAVAILSYSHYAGGGFQEHFGWIAAEYVLVFGALGWDWLEVFWGGRFRGLEV